MGPMSDQWYILLGETPTSINSLPKKGLNIVSPVASPYALTTAPAGIRMESKTKIYLLWDEVSYNAIPFERTVSQTLSVKHHDCYIVFNGISKIREVNYKTMAQLQLL